MILARVIVQQNYSLEIFHFTECSVHYECSDVIVLAVEVYQVICWVLYDFFLAEYLKELQNVESSTKPNNQLQEDI